MVSARLADGEVFDSAKLKNTVRFLIENDMRNVVIDLGNLEYLYSDTINAFIASNRHMLEVSGRIAILTEHPKVQDILKRAGLDNIMRIYRSEAEMIADSKEILRQTSSYRIEELQKISTQVPEPPPAPKTEFDEFKAEMGHRLGSKLDNNELPQYQLGVSAPATPSFTPTPKPREPETNYPAFNPPGFGSTQIPEPPAQGFPPAQPAPAYNFNNQAFGGMANTTPTFPGQGNQNFNQAPPNFDFPTVQLPIGQFGTLSQPQAPVGAQGGSDYENPSQNPPADTGEDELPDPRQRKPSQERMRSPNARKQQGRRVGGREVPEQDEEPVQNRQTYVPERNPEPPVSEGEKYGAYGNVPPSRSGGLAEEARFPAKLIVFVVALVIGIGLFWFLSSKSSPEKPVLDNPASQEQVKTPEPTTPPAPTAVEPVPASPAPIAQEPITPSATPATPVAPAVPVEPPVKPPVAVTPKPAAPVIKPTPEPKAPKTAFHKPKRVEKPAPVPAPSEEPTAQVPKAGLHITSNPPGAEVLINFSKKGTTPIDVTLSNNSNKIIVRLAGFKRFETTLPKNHPDHELEVNLEKEEGAAEPTPKPVATRPTPEPEKPRPEPKVERKQDFEDPDDSPMKSQAASTQRDPEPEAAPVSKSKAIVDALPAPGDGPIGIIFLSSSPARADIIIDGKNTGKKTPAKIELPSGTHRIEMSKSGQKSSVDQIVNEGKNKALHLTLQ
ncbi:MAG: PEGA domain-containing protein [Fibrobacteria bacterium]